jgi:hypothetical protein
MPKPKRRPIVVSGKFPSDDEVAAVLGISRRRQKELDRMMEEYFRQKRMRLSKTSTPRNGRDDCKGPRAR